MVIDVTFVEQVENFEKLVVSIVVSPFDSVSSWVSSLVGKSSKASYPTDSVVREDISKNSSMIEDSKTSTVAVT